MASAGVVSLKLIINLCRSAQFLFQAVSSYQRRRTVHFVKIAYILWNFDISRMIVKFLLNQFTAENNGKLFSSHRLMCCRIKKRGRFVFHIGPQVVPCLWHLGFIKVNLIRYFFVCHVNYLLYVVFERTDKRKKTCPLRNCLLGQVVEILRCHPAWRSAPSQRVQAYADF